MIKGGLHLFVFLLMITSLGWFPDIEPVWLLLISSLTLPCYLRQNAHPLYLILAVVGFSSTVLWLKSSYSGAQPIVDCSTHTPTGSRLFLASMAGPASRRHTPNHPVQNYLPMYLHAEFCHKKWQPQHARVFLTLPDSPELVRGRLFLLRLQIHPLPPKLNPFDLTPFDRRRQQNVSAVARVVGEPSLFSDFSTLSYPFNLGWIDRLRGHIAQSVENTLPTATAALVKALVIGDKGDLDEQQKETFSKLGISHLLCVSGLHIGIVIWLFRKIVLFIALTLTRAHDRRCQAVATWSALGAASFYCLLTGPDLPAVRATLMACFLLFSSQFSRKLPIQASYGLSGWLILLVHPFAIHHIGFQLSFAAVAVLLVLAEKEFPFLKGLPQPQGHTPYAYLLRYFMELFMVSVWVTLFTAPILAKAFGAISIVAPFVNMIAIPWGAFLVTPCALLHAWIATSLPIAAPASTQLVLWLIGGFNDAMFWLAAFLERSMWLIFHLPLPTFWQSISLLFACSGLFMGITLWGRRLFYAALACFFLTLLPKAWWEMALPSDMIVRQVYVGQGDSTWITLPRGETVLVDGGGQVHTPYSGLTQDPGKAILAPLLRRAGVRRIALMVITHTHPDHYGGLQYIAKNFPVQRLWWNGSQGNLPEMKSILDDVRRYGGVVEIPQPQNTTLQLSGVSFSVLQYPKSLAKLENFSENNHSLVIKIRYGERSVLLTGDIEAQAERYLAAHSGHVDILKVAHHGSRYSSTLSFLQAIRPDLALISCGRLNHYGFPHSETLQRFHQLNIPLLRTDKDGMIAFATDGIIWRRLKNQLR